MLSAQTAVPRAKKGQTKIRLEVRSASPEQFDGDFNAEKEWHKHVPTLWDVMQLCPAQALTSHASPVGPNRAVSYVTRWSFFRDQGFSQI